MFHLPQGPLKSNFFYCPGFLPAFSQFRNGLNATFITVLFTRSDEVQLFLLSKGALSGQVLLFYCLRDFMTTTFWGLNLVPAEHLYMR